jgi:alanine-glyoxylate transaminase / (R)-3-amino-2-methylpropionate-pyruvate transaminase
MTTAATSRPTMPPCAHQPKPYTGPSRAEVLATRRQYVNPAIFTIYREPLMLVEGHRQYLFDETGKRYLDLFAGIVTVSCGHAHPTVTKRIQEQLATLAHATTIYLHPHMGELARRIAAKLPPGLDVVYFVNSGSEANDLAVLMARLFTGHNDVIALRNAYHGASPAAMALTSHHTWKFPAQLNTGIHHTICPDPYRSPFPGTPEEIAAQSAADIRDLIRFSTPGKVAAYIAEPIQGVGGVTYGAPNYLKEAYAVVREHGGLCIADEVQTGFGRTGDHFWGFENWGVVPDIVTMAKGIGNGFPLAAVATRREVAEKLTQRIHFNTYGGNPVAMAAGLAVLDVIEEEQLQENARVLGARLKTGLEELATRHPLIGDVRGMGLMLGVELVRDRTTKEPAKEQTAEVMEQLRERGVLVGKGGLFGNVLRIKPPLCLSAPDVDFALATMDQVFSRVEG